MLLGAVVYWIAWRGTETVRARAWALVGVVLCLAMVAFSQSRSAWVVLVFLLFAILFLRFLRGSQSSIELQLRLFVIGLCGGGIAILLIEYLDLILALLGRDATLTGRTSIWAMVIEVGWDRLWLGHGYRTFWIGLIPFKYESYGNGHNSFIDLWLEMGLVGVAVFFCTLVILAGRAFWRFIKSRDALGQWYVLFVFYIIPFSMTSQVLPNHGTITWVLYVAALLHLSAEPLQRAERA
jgi:O-antigen ligase